MDNRTVTISWQLLDELYTNCFRARTNVVDAFECEWCGEVANVPYNIKHGMTGDEPCGVGLVKALLWPEKKED